MEEGLHCRGGSLLSGGVSDDDEQVADSKGIDDEEGRGEQVSTTCPCRAHFYLSAMA